MADVSKRMGMLKNGVDDVKSHKWFQNIEWKQLLSKKISMPFKPLVKYDGDASNFSDYPESDKIADAVKATEDPFQDW